MEFVAIGSEGAFVAGRHANMKHTINMEQTMLVLVLVLRWTFACVDLVREHQLIWVSAETQAVIAQDWDFGRKISEYSKYSFTFWVFCIFTYFYF